MKTILYFVGIAGSGKGTQSKLLAQKKEFPIIEVGAISRAVGKEDSERGRRVQAFLDAGQLIPHEITIQATVEAFNTNDAPIQIIDGFPRSVEQADGFFKELAGADVQHVVVHLLVGEREITRRLLERAKTEGRSDDTVDGINGRIEVYYKQAKYGISALRERGAMYLSINGDQTIEQVAADIAKGLAGASIVV